MANTNNFTLQLNIIPNGYRPTVIKFGAQDDVKSYSYGDLIEFLKKQLNFETVYCINPIDEGFQGFNVMGGEELTVRQNPLWFKVSGEGGGNEGGETTVTFYRDEAGRPTEELEIEKPPLNEGTLILSLIYSGEGEGGDPKEEYTITVTTSPNGVGTITYNGDTFSGGTYEEGTIFEDVTAPDVIGYNFNGWYKNGALSTNDTKITITVTGNDRYTAQYSIKTYTITATSDDNTMGTASVTGSPVNHGGSVTLTATPTNGNYYKFTHWNDNNTQNPRTISNVTESANYTAYFEEKKYTVSVEIFPEGAEQECRVSGTGNDFAYGTGIKLVATGTKNYAFAHWELNDTNVGSSNELNITVTENVTYRAIFEQPRGTISKFDFNMVDTSLHNEIDVQLFKDGGELFSGKLINLIEIQNDIAVDERAVYLYKLTVPEHKEITAWNYESGTFNTVISRNIVPQTSVMVEGNMITIDDGEPISLEGCGQTLKLFATITDVEYTISVQATTGGTVSGGGTGVYGSNIQISASANNGYRFTHWNDNNTQSPRTVRIEGNATYIATFAQEYEITTKANDYEGTTSGDGNYIIGQNVVLAAIPEEGYYFVKWIKDENFEVTISTDATYRFQMTADAAGEYFAVFATGAKTITVSVSSGNGDVLLSTGVSMLGEHQYAGDSEITFTATPNQGYHFKNWNGIDGDEPTITAMVHDLPESFDVVFEQTIYTITVENSDPTYGTAGIVVGGESNELEPTATFNYGGTCTIQAKPEKGYKFVRWDDENTDNPRTFEVTDSMTYIPIFTDAIKRIINVGVEGNGNVTGAGEYYEGETATLVAVPDSGYHFVHWKDDETAPATRNILVTEDLEDGIEFTAVFEEDLPDTVTISLSTYPNASGTVDGGGVKPYNSSVTVTATANPGCTFVNWKEGANVVSTAASYTFTATTNRTLVANFSLNTYNITASANPTAGGTVSGGGSVNHGAIVTLNATANTGYTFTNWTENGSVVSTNANYTFTAEAARTLVANFSLNTYTINVTADGGGTVNGGGSHNYGSTATVTAAANTGYRFVNWTENGNQVSENASYTFTVTTGRTLIAHFEELPPDTYEITVTANNDSYGTVNGGGTYAAGSTHEISATANEHYQFTKWSDNNTDNPRSITVNGVASYQAIFSPKKYEITVASNDETMGTVEGGGSYDYGSTQTITATAKDNHHFVNWSDGGNATHTITVTGNTTYTATFAIDTFTVSGNVSPNGAGRVTGGGSVNYGGSVTLVAEANDGNTFINWDNDSTKANPSLTITNVTSAQTHTAYFEVPETFFVHSSAIPEGSGRVSGGGDNIRSGETIRLRAVAEEDYIFKQWEDKSGNFVSTANPYEFVLMQNTSINARFGSVRLVINVPENCRDYRFSFNEERYYDIEDFNGDESIKPLNTEYRYEMSFDVSDGECEFNGWTINGTTFSPQNIILELAGETMSDMTITLTDNDDDTNKATIEHIDLSGGRLFVNINTETLHHISISANPTAGGTVGIGSVNGPTSGDYAEGETLTLYATPNTGYHIEMWYEDNEQIDNSEEASTWEITVGNEDAAYEVEFALNRYKITLATNNAAYGSIGSNKVINDNKIYLEHGETAILTPNANTGYHFTKWADNNSTTAQRTITATANATYTAIFDANQYQVTVTSNDATMGTVSGGGTYAFGTNATLTATANPGYHFESWSNGQTTPSISIQVSGNVNITAAFAITPPDEYSIEVLSSNAAFGTTTGSGTYTDGTEVTLTATPAEHCEFTGWTDGVNTATRTVTINSSTPSTFTANFIQTTYTVTLTAGAHGSVNPASISGVYGTKASVTATGDEHYHFTKWNDNDTNATREFTITGNGSYTASFAINRHTINAIADPVSSATVTGSGTYDYGETVMLVADPNPGWELSSWSNGDTELVTSVEVGDENATYTATFTKINYTVAASVSPAGAGSVTGTGTFTYDRQATLRANANQHYRFVRWSDNATANPYIITVQDNVNLTAIFEDILYVITVESDDNTMGTVTGGGNTFIAGTTTTITATPAEHYHFLHWSDGDENETKEIVINGDATYTAYFEIDSHEITVESADDTLGTVTGSGTYNYGQTAQITATANEHYHFVEWNDGNAENPRTITVTDDATYTASFEIDTHEITTGCNDDTMGTVTGADTYDYGTPIQLEAVPAEHYHFVAWNTGSTDNPLDVTVTEDETYIATFAIDQHSVSCDVDGNGSVSGTGLHDWGASATLTAIPAAHHHFVEWNDGSTNTTYTFTVEDDTVCTALFEIDTHEVTLETNDDEIGSVDGAGTYDWGSETEISATPIEHYHFVEWNDGNTDNPRQILVEGDVTYRATFEIDKHSVTITHTGEGSAVGAGTYNYGSPITIGAISSAHWHFVEWTDGIDTATRDIVVDEDKTYEITFEIDTHTIETNIEGEGTVTGAGVYNWGTTQTLVATPAEHWHFLNWSDGVETTTRTITIDGDASYTAIFEIDKHVITVNADGPGVIAVRDEGNDGISAQVVADYGSTVVLYAVPDYKCFLINWNDDDNVPVNGTGRIVETINDKVYYDEYALEVLVEGDGYYTAYFDDIPKQVVTTLPPQPNSHAIIYNGADANSILCAELIKYLILEEAAENNTEVEDIDVINYITVTDITAIQNHESATICGVTMGDRITSDIYNWFREYLLFVPNDESQIATIKKIAININRVENLYDDCFKNMAAYKQVTVATQEAIDALIPIDRQSFNKKIMAMMDLGEPVMYDYFVNNILSANTEVVNEIVTAGEDEIVEETKRLVQQFNRYGSDIWKVGNNRKAIVMMTGISLPAGFVVDEMFDEYDSLITFNRLNDGDFEVSIYNVMHQLKDWNGRRRLTTDEKILLQKNMFDAGAYMRDHYQGTGTPVSGTAIINEDKFTSLLKAKKL